MAPGAVKLTTTSRDGKTLILRIAEPGEVLGLHATVSGRPCELTGETLQPCQLDFLRREDFLRFLQNHADACLNAAQHLSKNCQSAYEMIRSLGLSHSVGEKLARLLLEWAADGEKTKEGIRIKVSLTHEEIAQLIGTSRETVTRVLSEFRQKKFAQLSGSTLLILNKPGLEGMIETKRKKLSAFPTFGKKVRITGVTLPLTGPGISCLHEVECALDVSSA